MNKYLFVAFCVVLASYYIMGLIVHPKWKIYYDLATNRTIEPIDTSNPRVQMYRSQLRRLRLGFGPVPCNCQDLTCGCCTGMNVSMFNFDRRMCMNFTYVPSELGINMDMYMNDQNIFSNGISGKNPPPLCIPTPIPYIPSIDFCVRFFNMHTTGYNLFTCIDFETRIERAPILVLHFDCLQMGQDGISYHKPDEIAEIEETPDLQEDEQIEVYDEVVEDGNSTSPQPNKSILKGEDSSKEDQLRGQTEVYDEVFEEELESTTSMKPNKETTTTKEN